MNESLVTLAESIDNARLAANANEATAPQSGVYGKLADALIETLKLIVGDDAPAVYESIMKDGNSVREAIDYVMYSTLSAKVEERFTIPGYESYAYTIDRKQFTVEFEDKLTGLIDHSKTIKVYAKWTVDHTGQSGIATSSVPFTK